jgi:hypothetical protein
MRRASSKDEETVEISNASDAGSTQWRAIGQAFVDTILAVGERSTLLVVCRQESAVGVINGQFQNHDAAEEKWAAAFELAKLKSVRFVARTSETDEDRVMLRRAKRLAELAANDARATAIA